MKNRMSHVERIAWVFWLLLLVSIPVTSFPWVASFSGGETPVSPLSIIPLVFVLFLGGFVTLKRGFSFSVINWPLVLFIGLTFLSLALSVRVGFLPYKGQSSIDRILRGLITLAIGLGFYLSTQIMLRSHKQFETSLRAIYLGLFLLLAWASVQSWIVLDGTERMPLWITRTHLFFSVRDLLPDRVTGLAYEPSWLGDQLVVLYFPFLIGSLINGISVFPKLGSKIPFEWVLLIWGMTIFFLTRSRISILSMVFLILIGYIYISHLVLRRLVRKWSQRWRLIARRPKIAHLFGLLCAVILAAILFMVAIWGFSKIEPRMDDLLQVSSRFSEFQYFYPNEGLFEVADRLAFAERISYWTSGLRTFSRYPLFGVGLGNAGFLFEEHLPAYAYQLTEIRNVLALPEYGFPNPKNLWIRILAESGILGFSSFVIWYICVGLGAVYLLNQEIRMLKMLGLAGIMALIVQVVEGLSLDSYALPQMWVALGFITAAFHFKDPKQNRQREAQGSVS
jgi:O-antigen ligase